MVYERMSPETVELRPGTDAPGYEPIVLTALDDDVRVVAKAVDVLS